MGRRVRSALPSRRVAILAKGGSPMRKPVTLAVVLAALVVSVTVRAGLLVSPVPPLNWTLGGVPTGLIEVPAAAPVGTTACPGVRPGAIVNSEVGQCTFNAVFAGSNGSVYIGTAGHCILGESPIGDRKSVV